MKQVKIVEYYRSETLILQAISDDLGVIYGNFTL